MPIKNMLPNSTGAPRRRPGPASAQRSLRKPSSASVPSGKSSASPQRRQPQQDGEKAAGRRPRTRGSNWIAAIIMVLITLGSCFFLAMFILQSASDLFGLNQEDKQVEVRVPEKSTITSIAALLYDKGVVNQPFTFNLYAGLKAEDEDILAGDYIFNSNDSYDQIILALQTGNTKKEEVTVTFIEGWTLYEIAMKLEENRVCDADEFMEYLNKGKIDYEFMNQIPVDALRYQRLEGYIFPDTYDFYVGMSPDLVADKFFKNFNSRITDDMRDKMKELNLSLDQTIILASIIQKEADDNVENKTVSQVFHNRLNSPENFPHLQSDVTIHYVEKFIKPFINRSDQPMYDAYNTYVCEGLPVGAICNPGLDAINAALEPDGTGFYYFVTDDAGTYYYATTMQQHTANIAKAEQVGGDNVHGINTMGDEAGG